MYLLLLHDMKEYFLLTSLYLYIILLLRSKSPPPLPLNFFLGQLQSYLAKNQIELLKISFIYLIFSQVFPPILDPGYSHLVQEYLPPHPRPGHWLQPLCPGQLTKYTRILASIARILNSIARIFNSIERILNSIQFLILSQPK